MNRDGPNRKGRDEVRIYRQKVLFRHCLIGTFDIQFFHFRLEGCSLQAQNLCSAAQSGNTPAGLLQHGQDMPALHIFKAARSRACL